MVVDIRFISGGKFSLTLGKLIYKFNNSRFSFQILIESRRFRQREGFSLYLMMILQYCREVLATPANNEKKYLCWKLEINRKH